MKRSAKYKKLYRKAKRKAFETPLSAQQDLIKFAKKMSKKMTAPEKVFKSILKNNGVEFEPQFILQGKIFDFYLPETHTLVEIQGDYWHLNEKIYDESNSDVNYQKYIHNKDSYKRAIAIGMGYNFFAFWEFDLNKNKEMIINELISLEIIKNKTI